MGIVIRVDQLDMDPHFVAGFSHAAFENRGHAKLLRDFGNLLGRVFEALRRGARDHFQITNTRKPGEDLFLDSVGEIRVRFLLAKVLKRQHRD